MDKDEFYIGYSNKLDKGIGHFIKRVVLLIFVIMVGLVVLWSTNQEFANEGKFELGTKIELKGVLIAHPYPMLRIEANQQVGRDVLLLGFGKFGAEQSLAQLDDNKLDGKQLKITGTLIYYDGKTLFEIDSDVEQNVEVGDYIGYDYKEESLGLVNLKGEVVDPKCYFGVMKPGYGKIHRSCGIRCISGGIPPVYVVSNTDGTQNYFLMTDRNGRAVNDEVLDFVGLPTQLRGELVRIGEWLVIKTNPLQDIQKTKGRSKFY